MKNFVQIKLNYSKVVYTYIYYNVLYNINNWIIYLLYLITFILSTVTFLGNLDFIAINSETISYIDQLDFTSELPELTEKHGSKGIISNFVELFNKNSHSTNLLAKEEWNNVFYIHENSKNKFSACAAYAQEPFPLEDKGVSKIYHIKKIDYLIRGFIEQLESINDFIIQ